MKNVRQFYNTIITSQSFALKHIQTLLALGRCLQIKPLKLLILIAETSSLCLQIYLKRYIFFRGAVYADMGHFERCITLWMYALDMQQKILEPLSPMTQSSLLSFAELFSFMMSEGGKNFCNFFILKLSTFIVNASVTNIIRSIEAKNY